MTPKTNAFGEGDSRFSAGLEIVVPTGMFANVSGTSFGASFRLEKLASDNLAGEGTFGFVILAQKTLDEGILGTYKYSGSMLPVYGGVKYYFMEDHLGFYAHAMLGFTVFNITTEVTPAPYMNNIGVVYFPASPSNSSASSTSLSIAPGIGYALTNVDIGMSYQVVSAPSSTSNLFSYPVLASPVSTSSSYLEIRIAFVFGDN